MNTITRFPGDLQGPDFQPTLPADSERAARPEWRGVEAERLVAHLEGVPASIRPGVSAPRILQQAQTLLEERAREYDRPGGERSVAAVVAALNAVLGREALTETEGWLFMRLLKDVRLFSARGYHADSGLDGVAYAALMAESRAREASRG